MKLKKPRKSTIRKIVILFIGLLLIIFDQILKFVLINKNQTLIPNLLNINYSQNTGIAFGALSSDIMLIMVITVVILGFILKLMVHYFNEKRYVYSTSLMLVFAGGFSNLLDRFLRGYVIDYLEIKVFNFPIFNFADILVTIGVLLLFILIIHDLIVPERKRKAKKLNKLKKKELKENEVKNNKNS